MNELQYKAILELLRQAKIVDLGCMVEGFYGEEFGALTKADQDNIQKIFEGFETEIKEKFMNTKEL